MKRIMVSMKKGLLVGLVLCAGLSFVQNSYGMKTIRAIKEGNYRTDFRKKNADWVGITTGDNVQFKVDEKLAERLMTIKQLLQDAQDAINAQDVDVYVPLPSISASDFRKLLELLETGTLNAEQLTLQNSLELLKAANYLDASKFAMQRLLAAVASKLTLDACTLSALFPFGSIAWGNIKGQDAQLEAIAKMIRADDMIQGEPRYSQADSLYSQLVGSAVIQYVDYLNYVSRLPKDEQKSALEEGPVARGVFPFERPSVAIQQQMAMLKHVLGANNYAKLREILQRTYSASILWPKYQKDLIAYLPEAGKLEAQQSTLNIEFTCSSAVPSDCKVLMKQMPLPYRLTILELMIENSGVYKFIPEIWKASEWKRHVEYCQKKYPNENPMECKMIRRAIPAKDMQQLKNVELMLKLLIGPMRYEGIKQMLIKKYE